MKIQRVYKLEECVYQMDDLINKVEQNQRLCHLRWSRSIQYNQEEIYKIMNSRLNIQFQLIKNKIKRFKNLQFIIES
ncbi:unnamed protein product [Paramecium sonneborni]|uniref:Uncharacterized protein n=1 Tax=Paramecium sonneborni TaxID=65129 RepID=A0A8S1RQ28_9CILI|nr:unnamed protein product [Paramecium sonneborni]